MGKNDAMWKDLAVDYELLKRQNQYYRNFHREIERQGEVLRRIRHDFSNLCVLQLSYLENGEYEKLRQLYLDVVGSMKASETVVHTGNIGFDSIVSFKLKQAEEQKLEIEKEIRVGGRILIDDRDINSLMGNLFDNAMEACRRVPEDRRRIRVSLSSNESMLYFEMGNSFDGQIRRNRKGEPVTRKADRKEHGIGLRTVKRIVKKYHGGIQIRHQENWFEIRGLLYFKESERNR